MEEMQQIPNRNQITPASPITTYPTLQTIPISKTPWGLIAIIVVLLGVTSYFGYQNYHLRQQLTSQQSMLTLQSDESISSPVASSSPITEWKTYRNLKYNYEIKQPRDSLVGYFDVRSGLFNTGKGEEDQLDILLTSQTELFKKFIQIEVTDAIAYKKTLSAAVNEIYSQQKEHFQTTKISELKPIKFLGYDGYEYAFTGQAMTALNWGGVVEEGEYHVKIFEKDKHFFAFYSRADQIFDQILSTFKFIE